MLFQAGWEMKLHTYRAEIAYDGGAFAGYAMQRGLVTVESTLLEHLRELSPRLRRLAAGGRTDRGVHATGQVISFTSRDTVRPEDIIEAIDRAVPGCLCALSARKVAPWFHAQFSASHRRYVYLLEETTNAKVAHIDRMLSLLVGRRCFGAFARDTPPGKSTVRTLLEARAHYGLISGSPCIRFDFCANGFLRRQVRVLVSTAVREAEAGSPDDVLLSLAQGGDRAKTAPPAPANGLYLVKIGYNAEGP